MPFHYSVAGLCGLLIDGLFEGLMHRGSEGSRWCVCVLFGVNRKKGILPRIFGRGARKSTRIVAAQPCVQFSQQLLVRLIIASLCRGHQATPSLGAPVPTLGPEFCSRHL